jgi:hypothetical protein
MAKPAEPAAPPHGQSPPAELLGPPSAPPAPAPAPPPPPAPQPPPQQAPQPPAPPTTIGPAIPPAFGVPSGQGPEFPPPPGATDRPYQPFQPYQPDQPERAPGLYGGTPAPAPARRGRKGLLIGLVVVGVLILLAVVGVVVTTALNRSSSFAVGSCVKQDGKGARQVKCTDAGAFQVVSKEDKRENCPDQSQPSVLIERDGGKTEVLCLRPADKK